MLFCIQQNSTAYSVTVKGEVNKASSVYYGVLNDKNHGDIIMLSLTQSHRNLLMTCVHILVIPVKPTNV